MFLQAAIAAGLLLFAIIPVLLIPAVYLSLFIHWIYWRLNKKGNSFRIFRNQLHIRISITVGTIVMMTILFYLVICALGYTNPHYYFL